MKNEDNFGLSEQEKQTLKELREAYNRCTPPLDFREKMEAITMGEMGTKKEKKRAYGWVRKLGLSAAAILLVVTVMANSNQSVAMAMEKIPVIGALTKVVTFRTYENEVGDYYAKVDVPKVTDKDGKEGQAASKINKDIKAYTDNLIAMHEADLKASEGLGKEAMETSYQVLLDNDRLFSLRLDTVVVMAGSNSFSKIYHIDEKADKEITLPNLFKKDADYMTAISANIKEQMRQQMKEDEMVSYFIDTQEGLDFEGIKADQNFYINKSGKLVMVFDKYEAAPGYMGMVEFEIPGEVIKSMLSEEGKVYFRQ